MFGISQSHEKDASGNPAGGVTKGVGFEIYWQDGPLGVGEERKPPNGAFVEDVIQAAIGRLEFYQQSPFACEENAKAIAALGTALQALQDRTADREKRGVEGAHLP